MTTGEERSAATESRYRYGTEIIDCPRCDGLGEVEDDLWVWTRCYSCWGRGTIEVCAECGDSGEECDACGC